MSINWAAIWEGVKEVGRLAFFAAITAVLGWLATELSTLEPTSVWYIGGTVVLRFLDKWVHENKEVKINGLAPF